jgi:hypothetical protein
MLANGGVGGTCGAATDSGGRGAVVFSASGSGVGGVVPLDLGASPQPLVKTNSDMSTADRVNIRMALWIEPLTHIPDSLIALARWNLSVSPMRRRYRVPYAVYAYAIQHMTW